MDEKTIIERLEEYTEKDPHAAIIFDETHTKGITYDRLYDMSGRVYRWLKENGIGKEDFVLINLPRGVLPAVAMIGVWKAGAALVIVEDTYASERINFIRKDCGCRTEINASNWDEIMRMEPLGGHEETDPHDAAFAVYTSGTTGNPKGVLHEYGNIERILKSVVYEGRLPFDEKDRMAVLAPMNFVATLILLVSGLAFQTKMYIASYTTIKNTSALARFFLTKRISVTFLTPSYARKLGNKTGPFLKKIYVGSEPANNLYIDNLTLFNVYASSESGFAVGFFKIDRKYDTCPIGMPQVDTGIKLLKDDGTEAENGEIGEFCYENPYVRGYINLPEQTEKAFVDGFFHSGDLAKKDENGNYVLLGRRGDMIKINGNRIEPAEIEAAIKEALGIDWVAVRGFEDTERSYLCAYYLADIEVDRDALRADLASRLPYYMIPAYYMKIDSIPVKATGKMDRMALPAPDISDYMNDYAAPETENQRILCEAFQSVLHLDKVGIHDDFYELGGDSLAAIELITICDLPGLNSAELFRGRTPEGIAALYEESGDSGENPAELNKEAMAEAHPLTAEQLYMVDYQIYSPASTMYNLFSMMKFNKEVFDMEMVASTAQKCIRNFPALLTRYFWDQDGCLMQRYMPESLEDIQVEHLSEFELGFVKDTLVYPYKIVGGRLYRCRVFETEESGYLFFDVHHSVFDGSSMKVFLESFGKLFMGIEAEPDYYYLMLKNREDAEKSAFYEECREYFEKRYDGIEWSCYPKTDKASRDNELGELIVDIGVEQPQMKAIEKVYRISRNEFFIAVAALAISIYNNENDIRVCWNYNGRDDMKLMNTVGLLFRELPVGIRFNDDMTVRELFADVREQVQSGLEHSIYPYMDIRNQVATEESAYLLYQQDIRDMDGLDGYDVEMIDIRQNQAASQTILDMEILDGKDGLKLMIDFAASWYEEKSIEEFKDIYIKIVHSIATHYGQKDITVREIKDKIGSENNFFRIVQGIFGRKR